MTTFNEKLKEIELFLLECIEELRDERRRWQSSSPTSVCDNAEGSFGKQQEESPRQIEELRRSADEKMEIEDSGSLNQSTSSNLGANSESFKFPDLQSVVVDEDAAGLNQPSLSLDEFHEQLNEYQSGNVQAQEPISFCSAISYKQSIKKIPELRSCEMQDQEIEGESVKLDEALEENLSKPLKIISCSSLDIVAFEFKYEEMVEWVAALVDPIEISLVGVELSPTAMVRTFSAHNVFERMPKWETEANSKELCALVAHVLVTQAPTGSCIVMDDKKFLVFDPGGALAFFNNGLKLSSSEIESTIGDAIFNRIWQWQWDPGGLVLLEMGLCSGLIFVAAVEFTDVDLAANLECGLSLLMSLLLDGMCTWQCWISGR